MQGMTATDDGFLSTPSARRATPRPIHPLLFQAYFYPRPPRGGRHKATHAHHPAGVFLSTPSARRATPLRGNRREQGIISIHALREEGDP